MSSAATSSAQQPGAILRQATTGGIVNFPQTASASSSPGNQPNSGPTASASSFPVKNEINGVMPFLLGVIKPRVWRPKMRVENPNYPRVTSPGCYFIEHSGGFQLILRATSKYLGHYTKAAIAELEKKYAKKKRSRTRKRK